MRAFKSPYQLALKGSLNAQMNQTKVNGLLLKIQFNASLVGYSSVQTYPQFGDPTLEEVEQSILTWLRTGDSKSQITKNIVNWANRDAIARKQNLSLKVDPQCFENHFLVNDMKTLTSESLKQVKHQGYKIIKFKMGRNLAEETQILRCQAELKNFKWRLDFNASLNKSQWISWGKENLDLFKNIEFVEDPIPFDLDDWRVVKQSLPVKLALDFHLEQHLRQQQTAEVVDVIVIKPMVDNIDDVIQWVIKHDKKYLFTSYLDHVIGQKNAQLDLMQYLPKMKDSLLACGLNSNFVFEQTSYSEFTENSAQGIGYTSLLQGEKWQEIL